LTPALSRTGTKVAFGSYASNLDPADTDGIRDIYVKDLVTGDIVLASTSDSGVKPNADSIDPHLSSDGSRVVFTRRRLRKAHSHHLVPKPRWIPGGRRAASRSRVTSGDSANNDQAPVLRPGACCREEGDSFPLFRQPPE